MRQFFQTLPHPIANFLFFVRRFKSIFFQDGMMVLANSDFRNEKRFEEAYKAAKKTGSFGNWEVSWRVHTLCWAATEALKCEGDFVECGTDHGGTAMAVIKYCDLENESRKFYLLDTFQGLDQELLSESESKSVGKFMNYANVYERVKSNFEKYSFVEIVKGSVPSTLDAIQSKKIAYLHLDMNSATPERAALEALWDRLSDGAVIVLDDYGWPLHIEQKESYDDFFSQVNRQILRLPTNQGLVIK
jgi:antirestriction protein